MSIAESAEESRTASLIFSPNSYIPIYHIRGTHQIQVKGFQAKTCNSEIRRKDGFGFPCHYPLIFRRYVLFPKTINNFPVNIFTDRILYSHILHDVFVAAAFIPIFTAALPPHHVLLHNRFSIGAEIKKIRLNGRRNFGTFLWAGFSYD